MVGEIVRQSLSSDASCVHCVLLQRRYRSKLSEEVVCKGNLCCVECVALLQTILFSVGMPARSGFMGSNYNCWFSTNHSKLVDMLIKFLSKTTTVNEYSNAGHFDLKSFVNCYTMRISVSLTVLFLLRNWIISRLQNLLH